MNPRTLATALALALSLVISASADTLTFDSVNVQTAPFHVDVTTTNLLTQYGITLVNNSPGTQVNVACANAEYNTSCTSGTGTLIAESGFNVLQQTGNQAESYSLYFSSPLSTLSFFTAGFNGQQGGGVAVAQWSATAFDGASQLGVVGQPAVSYYSQIAPAQWTLNGPDITSVTFAFNCYGFCGEALAIDNLSSPNLVPSVPEPPTFWLMVAGLTALLGMAVRRKLTLISNRI